MGKRPEQIFHQGRDMDGKQVHGKMFKIISHCVCVCMGVSRSVVSDSLQLRGL